jgi:hypothetical protein
MTGEPEWNFAEADRRTQDRLVRDERDSIAFNEEALATWTLDPQSERNARRNIEQSRATLLGWTGSPS